MTHLAMTKLLVADLDRCGAFYRDVCGFTEVERISGEGFSEWIMRPPGGAGAALVLLATGVTPPPGEAVLVFETADIAAFTARVTAHGGTCTQPPLHVAAIGLSYAMFTDPEGHVVEAIERDG